VLGIGAVPTTAIAALVDSDAPAAMENLDGACGDTYVDLGANEATIRMRMAPGQADGGRA